MMYIESGREFIRRSNKQNSKKAYPLGFKSAKVDLIF